MIRSPMGSRVGASLTAVTVTKNEVVVVSNPSVTLSVMVVAPLALAAGVTVTVRLAPLGLMTTFALGTKAVSDEVPLTLRSPITLSMSPMVKLNAPVVPSSAMIWSAMLVILGASLTAVTVTKNEVVVAADPSVTLSVMVVAPLALAAGVTVTVRLAPLGLMTTFSLGTRAVSDEVPLTLRSPITLSMSPMVKLNAPVVPSSAIVWSAMLVMLGASLTAVTVTKNEVLVMSDPSVTLSVMVVTPLALTAGVTVTVRLAPLGLITTFALGTKAVSDEVPLTLRSPITLSMSPMVKLNAPVVPSSAMVWSATLVMVGASLTAVTVTKNEVVVVADPSVTLSVMVVAPLALAAGVTVTVRLAPLGLITTFALGTRAVSDELPLTINAPIGLSISPMVKLSAPVVPSSAMI